LKLTSSRRNDKTGRWGIEIEDEKMRKKENVRLSLSSEQLRGIHSGRSLSVIRVEYHVNLIQRKTATGLGWKLNGKSGYAKPFCG
jgi:hypothetical protein